MSSPSASPMPALAASTEVGALGIMHLRRFWSRCLGAQAAEGVPASDPDLDVAVLHLLRLGIEPTTRFVVRTRPSFEEFERFVVSTVGAPSHEDVVWFNGVVRDGERARPYVPPDEDALTDDDWRSWDEDGYVVVPNALSAEACDETVGLICAHLGVDEDDPGTWYDAHPDKQGIMVQLFYDPRIEANRRTPRVRRVFEQLWRRNDLLPSADRVGFNPPVTSGYAFPGPDLHWDVSLAPPVPFGTQGVLYLRDTLAEGGALTVVPGMHRTLDAWVASLEEPARARELDLHALGSRAIAAPAGSLIVWHQALAHGSRPNHTNRPRFVQYVNYQPIRVTVQPDWL